ncbi:NUDIX domain-containing protein [Lacticigenium naphthae]|uniref:NUDIX domain-containing protein n=1 Tax=Lacticigenium naphthae TaxID=515351 RepID=UPI000418D493|nr:NUDIX hydrolase [Lacticigenium naphthae]
MVNEEKTLSSQTIYKGNITEYVLKEVELPDGKTSIREIVKHDQASAVIPFLNEDTVVFVKQFRKPIERSLYEIPAGLMDSGDKGEGLSTAKRELEEETGYKAKKWDFITSFYSSPGFTDEFLYIYEAKDLIRNNDVLKLDDNEFLEVFPLTFREAWSYYEKGEIRDAKSVFALFYWKNKLESNKDEVN